MPHMALLDFNQRRKSVLGAMANSLRPVNTDDDLAREQARPQMDYRRGVDDVTILPSGAIEPRRNPLSPQPSQPSSDTHPILRKINLSTTPPLPAPSDLEPESVPPPPAPPYTTGPAPTGNIGPSLGGKSGIERLRTLRAAMESAAPSSDVSIRGDQVRITPPRMKGVNQKGAWRRLGEGAVIGLASADPNAEGAQILGSAIGGAAVSSDPHSADVLKRNFELRQLDNDYARGLKIKEQEAQVGSIEALRRQREAEPELERQKQAEEKRINDEKLRIEEDRIQGVIDNQEADRRQREVERLSREKIAREQNETTLTVAGIRGSRGEGGGITPEKLAENKAKREAKLNESAALYKKAEQMEVEAANINAHIQKLEAGMATYDPSDTDGRKPFLSQIEDLKKAQARMREDANKLRTDGDKARADGESIPAQSAAPKLKWSASRWAAANKGKDVEVAKRVAEAAGYEVTP